MWTQQAYIKASNTDVGDEFGVSVALDDGTLAVGANGEDSARADDPGDNDNNDSGAVYIRRVEP